MSLIIVVYVPEGIVMASDSRQSITIGGTIPTGGGESRPAQLPQVCFTTGRSSTAGASSTTSPPRKGLSGTEAIVMATLT